MTVRYEKTDVSVGTVVRAGIVVFAVATIASLILLPVLWWFQGRSERQDQVLPPIARFEPGRQPPAPRLQVHAFDDLRALHAEEDRVLSTYGWVDRDAGIVRIPIHEAMHLLLERGLPVRPHPARDVPWDERGLHPSLNGPAKTSEEGR